MLFKWAIYHQQPQQGTKFWNWWKRFQPDSSKLCHLATDGHPQGEVEPLHSPIKVGMNWLARGYFFYNCLVCNLDGTSEKKIIKLLENISIIFEDSSHPANKLESTCIPITALTKKKTKKRCRCIKARTSRLFVVVFLIASIQVQLYCYQIVWEISWKLTLQTQKYWVGYCRLQASWLPSLELSRLVHAMFSNYFRALSYISYWHVLCCVRTACM